ncbi:MAG: hypothetical protein IJ654_10545 [Bacteroidales bacterium]|nr:hypothetical protein [Bacteroidales bacterium]
MDAKQIKKATDDLAIMSYILEQDYINNEGEVTEQTERAERQVAALKYLLTTEGIDSLGHWLKAKEDEIKTLKAEKDYIDRKIKAHAGTIDYIKHVANGILKAAGVEAVKGSLGYKFARTVSCKTTVKAEDLDKEYLDAVTEAARNAGLPACIDVALKTNATRLQDAGEGFDKYVAIELDDTCTFTKPRARKEA